MTQQRHWVNVCADKPTSSLREYTFSFLNELSYRRTLYGVNNKHVNYVNVISIHVHV